VASAIGEKTAVNPKEKGKKDRASRPHAKVLAKTSQGKEEGEKVLLHGEGGKESTVYRGKTGGEKSRGCFQKKNASPGKNPVFTAERPAQRRGNSGCVGESDSSLKTNLAGEPVFFVQKRGETTPPVKKKQECPRKKAPGRYRLHVRGKGKEKKDRTIAPHHGKETEYLCPVLPRGLE